MTTPRYRLRSGAGPQTGQALVEAALALFLVLTVLVGLVQVALYMYARNVVVGAVQDGARLAAADGAGLGEGETRARDLIEAGLGRTAADIDVTENQGADTVTIQADGEMSTIIPWINDSTVPLHAEATMSRERFRPRRLGDP